MSKFDSKTTCMATTFRKVFLLVIKLSFPFTSLFHAEICSGVHECAYNKLAQPKIFEPQLPCRFKTI